MLSWFTTTVRCPLPTHQKAWTEWRMLWLAERLGGERLLRANVLLPTLEFLGPPDKTGDTAQSLMEQLCPSFGVAPDSLRLQFVSDEQIEGAAGLYLRRHRQRSVILIAASQVYQPMALAATLAHEIAHEVLLGGELLDESVADHEMITDLLPVYLGVGLFGANATLSEASGQDGQLSWWRMQRQGYLPSRVLGYALALFAHARGEADPPWAKHLRPDAAEPLQQGLRYIHKTGDCLVGPDTIVRPPRFSVADLLARLSDKSPTVRVAAMWSLTEQSLSGEMVAPVQKLLSDTDSDVAAQAATTLGKLGQLAAPALPALLSLLHAGAMTVRRAAVEAVGTVGLAPLRAGEELAPLLHEDDLELFRAAARTLARLNARLDAGDARYILRRLETALIKCDYELSEELAEVLSAVMDEPRQAVRQHFSHDAELRRLALELVPKGDAARRATPEA